MGVGSVQDGGGRWRRACAAAACMALAGCTTTPRRPQATAATPPVQQQIAWRGLVQPADLSRIEGLAADWIKALGAARGAGFTRRLRQEGPLFDPAIALPVPAPAPGAYRCRLFRLGGGARGRGAFSLVGSFFCFISVEGRQLRFVRETGSPRPVGFLYDDSDDTRLVFIGAAAGRRETSVPAYGDRLERNVVGVMQRVGNFRYRLVLPSRADTPIEVYELTPVL